jgi:hypothetical protein
MTAQNIAHELGRSGRDCPVAGLAELTLETADLAAGTVPSTSAIRPATSWRRGTSSVARMALARVSGRWYEIARRVAWTSSRG